jgi:FMN phosphatase YigB (HAD superfamily)
MTPLYIFDLDGTLADIEHHRHFVEKRANKWDEFYTACHFALPKPAVIDVYRSLAQHADIWIFSGRSDVVRDMTHEWLDRHVRYVRPEHLLMRPYGDFTLDDVLKRKWYDAMLLPDKDRLVATFDDRDRVVKMWRDLGVTCFQVAPGDF